jgi:hypothetical protein
VNLRIDGSATTELIVTAKQSSVKRYVVKLSDEEREWLDALTHMGNHPARVLTEARIPLTADALEAGEGWSDSRIAEALDTSTDSGARTRQQLVEEGFEAVLVRKQSPASARPRIFDGERRATRKPNSTVKASDARGLANAMRGPDWPQSMAAEGSTQRHIIAIGVVAGAYRTRVDDRSQSDGCESHSIAKQGTGA